MYYCVIIPGIKKKMRNLLALLLLTLLQTAFCQFDFDENLILENNITKAEIRIESRLQQDSNRVEIHKFRFGECGKIKRSSISDKYNYQMFYDSLCNQVEVRSIIIPEQIPYYDHEKQFYLARPDNLVQPKFYYNNYIYKDGNIKYEESKFDNDTFKIHTLYHYNSKNQLAKKSYIGFNPIKINEYKYDKKSNIKKMTITSVNREHSKILKKYEYKFKYNKDNLLEKIRIYKTSGRESGSNVDFKYNSMNKLEVKKFKDYNYPDIEVYSAFENREFGNKIRQVFDYYSNGLLKSIKEYINDELITTVDLTYEP